jgi:hypothetical protein
MAMDELTPLQRFAFDLEAVINKAVEAGVSKADALKMLGTCVGYAASNGAPNEDVVNNSLRIVIGRAFETAAQCFAETRPAAAGERVH